jgi:serine/threonine-protein kinase TTK/MPS1
MCCISREIDEVNKVIKIVLERGSTDLAGYLRKHPDKITVDFIKMCWRKMLDAVDVIHKAGIIHTDLKPANFLLVEWNLKLIDFGIANAVQVCFRK